MPRYILGGIIFALLIASLGLFETKATELQSQSTSGIPVFEVDQNWPQIPAEWSLGDVSSVTVDTEDHVWVLHRPRTANPDNGSMVAPPVLELDPSGRFLQAWGGSTTVPEWPEREHGIHVDDEGNIWVGGNNCVGRNLPGLKNVSDDQLLKLTRTGTLVMQIGRSNNSQGNSDTRNTHQPADAFVYTRTNEVFVADGYGNHRVIVFDATTGAFKRMWGGFGRQPIDADECPPPAPTTVPNDGGLGPAQFGIVHGLRVSDDGLVYVADREHKRVQVFTIQGEFVDQAFIDRSNPETSRTASSLGFSADAEQRLLYVAGGRQIAVLDRRTLATIGSIQTGAHHMAVDSVGNIYTAQLGAPRSLQKLVLRGFAK